MPKGRALRGLTALLAAEPNRLVTYDRMKRALWDSPPTTAKVNLRGYLSQLRKLFDFVEPGAGASIQTVHGSGATLLIGELQVDMHEFTHLVEETRCLLHEENVSAALRSARSAAALIRGDYGNDLPSTRWFLGQETRISEIQRQFRADFHVARLLGGDHDGLVSEIEDAARDARQQDHMWVIRAAAHYLTGNTVTALNVIRAGIDYFPSTYGIDPPCALNTLHRCVLNRMDEQVREVVLASVLTR